MLFTQPVDGLADLLGISQAAAGYILGMVLIAAFSVAFLVAAGRRAGGPMSLIVGTILGLVLAVLFEWIPPWTVIFIGLALALMVKRAFSGTPSEGGV